MIRTMRTLLLPIVMFGIVIAVACGNGGRDESASVASGARGAPGAPAFEVTRPGEVVIVEKEVIKEVMREVGVGETFLAQGAPAAMATPAPRPP